MPGNTQVQVMLSGMGQMSPKKEGMGSMLSILSKIAASVGLLSVVAQGLEPILRPVLTLLKLVITVLFLPLVVLMLPLMKNIGQAIRRIIQSQKDASESGGNPFAAGLLQMIQEPSIWGAIGGIIAAGMAASSFIKGIGGLISLGMGTIGLAFGMPEKGATETQINGFLGSLSLISRGIGFSYLYSALNDINNEDFTSGISNALKGFSYLKLATGDLKGAGVLMAIGLGFEMMSSIEKGDYNGEKFKSDITSFIGQAAIFTLIAGQWQLAIPLAIIWAGLKFPSKEKSKTSNLFGDMLLDISETFVPKINSNPPGFEELTTNYALVSGKIQQENEHMFGMTKASTPLGWAINEAGKIFSLFINTTSREWKTFSTDSQVAINSVIIELQKIPREVHTKHIITTVRR